jgi:hypothetical protein
VRQVDEVKSVCSLMCVVHPCLHELRIRSVPSPELTECFRKLLWGLWAGRPPCSSDASRRPKMRLLARGDLWTASVRYKLVLWHRCVCVASLPHSDSPVQFQ